VTGTVPLSGSRRWPLAAADSPKRGLSPTHSPTPLLLLLLLLNTACTERTSPQLSHNLTTITLVDAGTGTDAGTDAGLPVFTDDGGCACGAWGAAANAGMLGDPELIELSGLAASRAHPGVLWAHNDSGDTARFFAVSTSGAGLGRFALPGVVARDIEDIAVGPCPQGSCVYLGDIGDNLTARDDYAVYRVAEPALGGDAGFAEIPVSFERLEFAYPNGVRHNAETLLVHPGAGEVYVLTKHGLGTKSRAYRFPQPLSTTSKVVLEFITELPVPASGDYPLTGGDISPCGNAVLLRLYNRVVELRMAPGQPFESAFTAPVKPLPTAVETQGEAVTWGLDGKSYFTASEGSAQQLHRVECP
jgi:hypothetical protein